MRVFTERRRVDADVAVICAGPWAPELLKPLGIDLPLEPGLGQVSYFTGDLPYEARPSLGERIHEDRPGIYGLPTPGVGYKLGYAVVDRRSFIRRCTRARSTGSSSRSSWSRCARTSRASAPRR